MVEEEEEIVIMEEEEMSTTTTTILLPQDILMDILSRLPAKSLLSSFKLVCKAWCTTIKDPDFVKIHLNRGTINEGGGGSLIRKNRYGNTFFQLHPPFNCEAKIIMDIDPNLLIILESGLVGSCNGLLCLSVVNKLNHRSIVLLNPSTRKYKVSPEEPIQVPFRFSCKRATFGFGCYYNSITGIDEYKVVRIACFYQFFDNPESYKFQIDIYSMSSNSWRRWRRDDEGIPCGIFQEGSGVFVNEAFHWNMGSNKHNYDNAWDTIVTFSIRDEVFRQVPMPPCADVIVKDNRVEYPYHNCYTILMNVRGCLGKVYFSRTEVHMIDIKLEIWVMKEYGIKESWTKEFVIQSSDSNPPWKLSRASLYSRYMTCFLVGDQILIEGSVSLPNSLSNGWARGYGRRVLYDMNKKKIDGDFRMFNVPPEYYRNDQVDYIETLVSLKSSNNRKRKDTESLRNQLLEDVLLF